MIILITHFFQKFFEISETNSITAFIVAEKPIASQPSAIDLSSSLVAASSSQIRSTSIPTWPKPKNQRPAKSFQDPRSNSPLTRDNDSSSNPTLTSSQDLQPRAELGMFFILSYKVNTYI
jgi:hypothetical protein